MEINSNERYRLARIPCRDEDALFTFRSGHYDEPEKVTVLRDHVFSRVSTVNEDNPYDREGYRNLERMVIYYENVRVINENKGTDNVARVYGFDENLVAKPLAALNDAEAMAKVMADFKEKDESVVAMERLAGQPLVSLTSEEFQDGDNLQVIARDPSDGYEFKCLSRDYTNLQHFVYLPVVESGSEEITLKRLNHKDSLYRSTDITRNSYWGVPAGTWLVLTNLEGGEAKLVDADTVIDTADSVNELLAKTKDKLFEKAKAYAGIRLIDFASAELYVIYEPIVQS